MARKHSKQREGRVRAGARLRRRGDGDSDRTAGFALDVGHAYLVQRQLQSATDAAALAGALDLPVSAQAIQTAKNYGPEPGSRNAPAANDNATIGVQTKCVTAIVTGCTPANGQVNSISVNATSEVKTIFARVIGINSFTVHAKATACSPCSVKPLDIMLVLDRTGSMCQFSNGSNDPACTDLKNAREGIKTFLRAMNPQFHHVGLAVLPPSTGTARNAQCSPPSVPDQAAYDSATASYLMVPLSSDFAATPGTLNVGSTLVDRVECQQVGGGRTGYANALDAASTELQGNNGRAGYRRSSFSSPMARRTTARTQDLRSTATSRAKQASTPPPRRRRRGQSCMASDMTSMA